MMKNKFTHRLAALLMMVSTGLFAQSIGVNNPTPDPSAALDVVSTSKGVLVPRMTAAQRNLIASPATGLLVYQTDEPSGFYFYANSIWTLLGATGPQGLKGDKGDIGATGPQGLKGDKGDTGEIGPQGVKGDKGDTGETGPQGLKGDKGDTGETGPQGLKGDKGDTGEMGPQGLKGDKGDTGETGPQGLKGDQGIQGLPGTAGTNGQGVPTGGTAGQVLSKIDGTDYSTQWVNDNSWKLNGNTGTGENDYVGNTDNKPINFKVNNTLAGYISAQDTDYNTSIGYKAKAAGLGSVAIGYGAGNSNTSAGYTAVGAGAFENRASLDGVAIGNRAGRNMGGSYNIAIGRNAMQGSSNPINNTGTNNIVLGNSSMLNVTSGYDNIAIGNNNLMNTTTSNGLIAIGKNIDIANRNNVLAIGNDLPNSTFTQENMTRIGNNLNTLTEITGQVKVNAQSTTDNFTLPISRGTANQILSTDGAGATSWVTASSGSTGWALTGNSGTVEGTNFIGNTDDKAFEFRVNNIRTAYLPNSTGTSLSFGYGSLPATSTGANNIAIGKSALPANTSTNRNIAIGNEALFTQSANIGSESTNNIAIGHQALRVNQPGLEMGMFLKFGIDNTAIGNSSLAANTSGRSNIAIGTKALTASTTGHENVAVGFEALKTATYSLNNTAIGYSSLSNNATGVFNTALGSQSGLVNNSGSNNTLLGSNADVATGNLNNSTAIGNGAVVDASNKIRLGNSSVTATDIAGQVKVNAQSATNSFTLPATRGTANQVLSTDGAGATSWVTPSSGAAGSFPNVEVSDKATANQTITDKANANPPTFSTLLFSGTNSTNASLSSGNTWNGNTFTVGAGNAGWYQVSAQVVGVQTSGSNANNITSTGIVFILDKNNFVTNTPGLQTAPVHANSVTNNTQYPLAISTNAQTVLTSNLYFRNANIMNTVVYLSAGDFITLRGVSISNSINAVTSNDGSTRIEIVRVK